MFCDYSIFVTLHVSEMGEVSLHMISTSGFLVNTVETERFTIVSSPCPQSLNFENSTQSSFGRQRAARLFFLIRPIILFIHDAVVAD